MNKSLVMFPNIDDFITLDIHNPKNKFYDGAYSSELAIYNDTPYILEDFDIYYEDDASDEQYGTAVIDFKNNRYIHSDYFIINFNDLKNFLESLEDSDWESIKKNNEIINNYKEFYKEYFND